MMQQRTKCHILVKPTGSICNLDCEYCYYLEKSNLYPERNSKANSYMSLETLEAYISQYIAAQKGDTDEVLFSWQGGEPLLAGKDFFRKAFELQKKYCGNKTINNTLQTNGLLIDDEWCSIFKQNNILIGISIDGPAKYHDEYRYTKSKKGTHHKVVEAIGLLKSHGVEFNTLTVINNLNVHAPLEVYQYLKSLGSKYMQFIPLVETISPTNADSQITMLPPDLSAPTATLAEFSVPSLGFGQFLTEIFNHWSERDVGEIFVPTFDHILETWYGHYSTSCCYGPICGSTFALEANGDLYVCDHYVYSEYKLGNIHQTSVEEMNNSQQNHQFGCAKFETLSDDCKQCKFVNNCFGDCPKHRFLQDSQGNKNKSYLCEGLKHFFAETEADMKLMAMLLKNNFPASHIMKIKSGEMLYQVKPA